MCGTFTVPALTALSQLGSRKSGGIETYNPSANAESEITVTNPEPPAADPTLNSDIESDASKKKGKSALVIQRNPGVTVTGSSGGGRSGVNVVN